VSDTQITATFQVASNAPSGNNTVTVTTSQGTSNSQNFYVQIPAALAITSDSTESVVCSLNGNSTNACLVLMRYQVQDQEANPQAIQVPGMIIYEYIHLQNDYCKTGGPTPGVWVTDNTGSMPADEPDGNGTCSGLCNGGTACTESWYQKFEVFQAGTYYPVSIGGSACNYWNDPLTPAACSSCAARTVGACPSPY
jgi:hypothetical protein